MSGAHALSTIVVERVIDVVVVLIYFVALIPFVPLPQWASRSAESVGLVAVVTIAALMFFSFQRERGLRLLRRLLAFVPRIEPEKWVERADSLIRGFTILHSPGPLIVLLLGSLVIWGNSAIVYFLGFRAFGIGLPFSAAVFVMCATVMGMTVPSSPGYIGVFHYITVLALSIFGIDRDVALPYALVLHASIFGTLTLFGLLSLWRESFSLLKLGELRTAKT